MKNVALRNTRVAVVGMGYVGLPLALELGKNLITYGIDISEKKIKILRQRKDPSNEVPTEQFKKSPRLSFESNFAVIRDCDIVIVAVPTPVTDAKIPDLEPLKKATESVGRQLRKGAIVVYESTVFPGVTEDICVPLLESSSNLTYLTDFNVGYSPERVNPGDPDRKTADIIKLVAADTPATLDKLEVLYGLVIKAGIYRAPSIMVAEAAKVIENTQRDLNIALVNELAIIFDKMNIDTHEVLAAARTKWNFLNFTPGLVGGHCIGVDPYYLTYKAQELGHIPETILAGRRINDSVAKFIAEKTLKLLAKQNQEGRKLTINVFGLTFKENCSDIRNSKVVDLIMELQEFGCVVSVHDPYADADDVFEAYNIPLTDFENMPKATANIFAVAHDEYRALTKESVLNSLHDNGLVIDIKSIFNHDKFRGEAAYWRL